MATNMLIPETSTDPGKLNARRSSKSPNRLAMERFMKNKMAVASVIVLLLIVAMSLAAPLLTHWNPRQVNLMIADQPPSAQHLLGTDDQGIDYLARDLYGGRADLLIGFVDMVFVMVIGIVLGGLAGYYGGWIDSIIMRFCDFMFNFPFILLIIVIVAVFNFSNIWLLICVIAFTSWPAIARLVRGLFLSLRESEYVLAAQTVGAGVWRIILKHMLPNSIGPLVVNATLLMSNLIGAEAALAIVGFGVKQPSPSWGNVLSGALNFLVLQSEPWAWIPPAFLITLTILCMNFIGDGLRDAFDPTFEK
ncbi:oligopeptide ABC transporter permease [Alicyclobacillus kakegawensis]|uniref:oligopeptide ABC transporter permease n=1 Tax=Alicyclobacillus kakegawensis TaxID=392012 RepID=UPI000A80C73C|nr:oligopeptide ABC transporter permease [Alicyclobacillus kakegawensis]